MEKIPIFLNLMELKFWKKEKWDVPTGILACCLEVFCLQHSFLNWLYSIFTDNHRLIFILISVISVLS